jgi:hypothetical protein
MVLSITAGMVVGTFGVCLASWTISLIGAGVTVLSAVVALATGIMEDVDEEPPTDLWPIGGRYRSHVGRDKISS